MHGCVTWSPRACHYDTLRRAHHRFLTRCIGWRKHYYIAPTTRFPISTRCLSRREVRTSRRLYAEGGSRLRDLWRAWRIRDCRSAWCSERWWGARAVSGARKKSGGWGVSWTTSELSTSTPTSGRLQPRRRGNGAERQNKGRNISWQNWSLQKKTRLDYSMCGDMLERDGNKDQEEDSPKQAVSCWFARPCWLATSGANLCPPGVWFADVMTSFSGVTFVFVLLRFRLYAFVEVAALRSINRPSICRRPDIHTCLFICFFLFWEVSFTEYFLYHLRFLLGCWWRIRRTLFPSEWCFSTLWPRAGFFYISLLLCENSIQFSSITVGFSPTLYCRLLTQCYYSYFCHRWGTRLKATNWIGFVFAAQDPTERSVLTFFPLCGMLRRSRCVQIFLWTLCDHAVHYTAVVGVIEVWLDVSTC